MHNYHVLVVHFPIAFLSLYAVLEILRFKKFMALPYWFYVKAILAILGALSVIITMIAGSLIEDQFKKGSLANAVSAHEFWAGITFIIFGFMAVMYLIAWINRTNCRSWFDSKLRGLWKVLTALSSFILDSWLAPLIALLGLISITITGALGSSIAFGTSSDPFAAWAYKTFVK